MPRLVGTRAWISSSTTVSTERSTSRALRGEQKVDRFRSGDQDVGGVAGEAGALGGGGVTRADGDGGFVELDAGGAGGLRDAH